MVQAYLTPLRRTRPSVFPARSSASLPKVAPRVSGMRGTRRFCPLGPDRRCNISEMQAHGGEEIAQVVGCLGPGWVPHRGIDRDVDQLRHSLTLFGPCLNSDALSVGPFEHGAPGQTNADRLWNQ